MSILGRLTGRDKIAQLEQEKADLERICLQLKSENLELEKSMMDYGEGRMNMEILLKSFAKFARAKAEGDWRDKEQRNLAIDFLNKVKKIAECAAPLIRRSKSDSRYNNALRMKVLRSLESGYGIPDEAKRLWQ